MTAGHTRRVQAYCAALAREFGIADEGRCARSRRPPCSTMSARLASPSTSSTSRQLTAEEYDVMKGHVGIGVEILSGIEFPFPVVPIVKSHHENWNGTGYPMGLRGEAIRSPPDPHGRRLLRCGDIRTPVSRRVVDSRSIRTLQARRGTMCDPRVVDTFIGLQPRLAATLRQRESAADGAPATASSPSVRSISAQR